MKLSSSLLSVALTFSGIAGAATSAPRLAPGFPSRAFEQARNYLKKYPSAFQNKKYLTIVDFTKPSSAKRLFIVNLETGGVEARLTSHGRGSDPRNRTVASVFGKTPNSSMTSLGFYRTLGTYYGKHGEALQLQGVSASNDNALKRNIVIHEASYVNENQKRAGRSQGCFALDDRYTQQAIRKIKGGSLLYAWSGQ